MSTPVVLITGVSSGIGRATAHLLAERGGQVYGACRTAATMEAIKGVTAVAMDVRDDQSVRAGVDEVLSKAGRIDVLINNAGVTTFGAVEELSVEEARDLFETNFFGVMRLTKAVLPQMRERRAGRIINVGSNAGFLPTPFESAYGASKHAIEGFSESLKYEVEPFGIHVSIIQPGFVRTGMDVHHGDAARRLEPYAAVRKKVTDSANTATKKGAPPEMVAEVILKAMQAKRPRLRYLAGWEAFGTRIARSLTPPSLFAWGVRQELHTG